MKTYLPSTAILNDADMRKAFGSLVLNVLRMGRTYPAVATDPGVKGDTVFNSDGDKIAVNNGVGWKELTLLDIGSVLAGTGTVTSVAQTVPTGFSIAGSPIIGAGTLAISYVAGYSLPLTADTAKGVTANGWGNHAGLYAPVAGAHNRAHNLLTVADHADVATYLNQSLLTSSTPQFAKIGIGTAAGANAYDLIRAAISNNYAIVENESYSTNALHCAIYDFRKSNHATIGTMVATGTTHLLGSFRFLGVNTALAFAFGAQIYAKQNGAAGVACVPTDVFLESSSATAANANQLVLYNDGKIGINKAIPTSTLDVTGAIAGSTSVTAASFVIGANTLNTTEWAFLDGQDQSVFSTSAPSFATGTTITGASGAVNLNIQSVHATGTPGIRFLTDNPATQKFIIGARTNDQFSIEVGTGVLGTRNDFVMGTTGFVGFGAAPLTYSTMYAYNALSNQTNQYGLRVDVVHGVSSGMQSRCVGFYIDASTNYSADLTGTNWIYSLMGQCLHKSDKYVQNLDALNFAYGIYSTAAVTSSIGNIIGIRLTPYLQTGTNTALFADIYIDTLFSGGTFSAAHWSICSMHVAPSILSGSLKLGAVTLRATTEGTNALDLFNGTPPVGTLANGASIYVTTGHLYSMDSGGVINVLNQDGNMALGGSAFGANSVNVLSIANGTVPAAHVDNTIQIYSVDSSDATATLGLMLEQVVEDIGTFTASHKIKVKINGTEYWFQLDAV